MADYVPTASFGGSRIGTELLYGRSMVQRLTPPIEQEGLGRDSALLFDPGTNLIWRPRMIFWHETESQYDFQVWMVQTARLMRRGRQDLQWVWQEGVVTWPKALFVSFEQPDPNSPLEAKFSDAIAANFVTDYEPVI